ncbi:MAG: SDR family NAD(P)-dependent oxidoreductase [candidate division KSB1 bacterium]|jgi:NAD dependent epimerase/dehydratase|nr:SDR family NAD(P)-dependent oxidoreductase [candidate division KSB1 bacterium]
MNWENKKVFVTGAGGFIGSHLTEALVALRADVRVLVQYNSKGSWGFIEQFDSGTKDRIEVVAGDVRDFNLVKEAVSDRDVVFHLAALIAIPYSYSAPTSYVETNIKGTLNVLQVCREARVEKMVHTSTSETYGTAIYTPIDEEHPMQGQSPYSASKIGADKMAESYYCSFGLPVATIRPFNTYGPRQSSRAIIPTIISQMLTQDEIHLGSLEPVRDFNYVKDTVDGFIKIAESERSIGEVINVGSGKGISIGDLVTIIEDLMDKKITVITEEKRKRPANSEVMTLICGNKKAHDIVGWEPRFSFRQGLSETIDYIKDHLHEYKVTQYQK